MFKVREASDDCLGSPVKMKRKIQTLDFLTGPLKVYGTQVTVDACGPLVLHLLTGNALNILFSMVA